MLITEGCTLTILKVFKQALESFYFSAGSSITNRLNRVIKIKRSEIINLIIYMSKSYSSAVDLKRKISKLNLHKSSENYLGYLNDVFDLSKKCFPYDVHILQLKKEKNVQLQHCKS